MGKKGGNFVVGKKQSSHIPLRHAFPVDAASTEDNLPYTAVKEMS